MIFLCTIGTTIKMQEVKKHLESRFWISTVCRFCFKNDVKQFLIISSLGADKAAGIST
jgi:hypothetical protein